MCVFTDILHKDREEGKERERKKKGKKERIEQK